MKKRTEDSGPSLKEGLFCVIMIVIGRCDKLVQRKGETWSESFGKRNTKS